MPLSASATTVPGSLISFFISVRLLFSQLNRCSVRVAQPTGSGWRAAPAGATVGSSVAESARVRDTTV